MKFKSFILSIAIFSIIAASSKANAMILITEVLADPPSGLAGDANGDGVGSTSQDEFVELLNAGSSSVDISNWFLTDAVGTRHTFLASTILMPNEYFVVFGGGSPALVGVNWQTASSGSLGLNNGGDTISLFRDDATLIDQMSYASEGGQNQSLARFPEEAGGSFILHSTIGQANGAAYSPGTGFSQKSASTTVPEPATALTFLIGGLGGLLRRKNSIRS